MGRQVGLVLLGGDESEVLQRIQKAGPFVLYRKVSREKQRPLPFPLRPATAATDGFDLSVVLVPIGFEARVPREHISTVGHHVIDHFDGEMIDFSRPQLVNGPTPRYGPKPDKSWVEHGRLWFDPRDRRGRPKSPEFVAWAESALRRVRRSMTRIEPLLYIGPEARRAVHASQVRLTRL